MAELNMKNVVLSVTIFFTITYVICGIFYMLLPEQTIAFFSYLFHSGISMTVVQLSIGKFIIGLIEIIILSIIGSALFVLIYNKFAR